MNSPLSHKEKLALAVLDPLVASTRMWGQIEEDFLSVKQDIGAFHQSVVDSNQILQDSIVGRFDALDETLKKKLDEELLYEVDEDKIVSSVLSKVVIPEPIPGKDADETAIVGRVLPLVLDSLPNPEPINVNDIARQAASLIPKPKAIKAIDKKEIISEVLSGIKFPEPAKLELTQEDLLSRINKFNHEIDWNVLKNVPYDVLHPKRGSGRIGRGGATTFLQLTDTPSSYTSQALKAVRVNAAATGLEFYTPVTSINWGDIGGTLSDQIDLQAALDAKPSGSGTATQLPYWSSSTGLGSLDGSSVDDTNQRLGIQKATPESPIHVAATVASSLANVTNLTASLVAEVAVTVPVLTIEQKPLPSTPTTITSSEVNTGSGFFSAFTTQNYEIFAGRTINSVNYVTTNGTTSYTEGAGNTYDVYVQYDLMANAEFYYVYNTTSGQWYTLDSVTNNVTDNGTGGSAPSYVLVSSPFVASGQIIDFAPVGIGTSPSGGTYYSTQGTTVNFTDPLNDGSWFIIQHNFTSVPAGGIVLKDLTNTVAENIGAVSTYMQTSAFGSPIDTSTTHYGFQANGSNLNRTYRVNSYSSYYAIYGTGTEVSTTDPNDSAYYSVSASFTGVTANPAVISYKKFRKLTSGAYGNSIFSTATSFVDDNLSSEYAQSATVTPTSGQTNAFVAEGNSSSVTGIAIGVVRSTATSSGVASFEGQDYIGGMKWRIHNDSSGHTYLGNNLNTNIYLGNLTAPQASFGASNVVNIQKNSAVHFTVWGASATLPNFYSRSNQDMVYFGRSEESSDPNAQVLIQPKSASKRGLIIRGFASQSADLMTLTNSASAVLASISSAGNFGVGSAATSTVRLTVAAGSTTVVPVRLTAGSLASSPVTGGIEFLGNNFYATITTGAARKVITLSDTTLVSGRIPVAATDGRLTDNDGFIFVSNPGVVINEQGTSTMGLRVEGDTDQYLLMTNPATDFLGVGVQIAQRKFHVVDNTAVTNAVRYVSRFTHGTSGTAAVGFGIGHEFEMENASGTLKVGATQEYTFTDATNATEDVTWKLRLMKAGTLTDALTVSSVGDMTVVKTLNFGGGFKGPQITSIAAYTLTVGDWCVNWTSGTVNATLPTAVGIKGQEFILKNSGTGIITILTTSSQTIDGVASGILTLVQYDCLRVQSDGANWIRTN